MPDERLKGYETFMHFTPYVRDKKNILLPIRSCVFRSISPPRVWA